MSISACLISHNEQDLILNCLNWLNSLKNLDEICILDDFSTDKTWEMIRNFKTDKIYNFKQQEFENFGKQKNDCIAMSTGKWILLIDSDETYSYQIDGLLGDINSGKLEQYNCFRIMTLTTYPDKKHCIGLRPIDPHVRIWKNGFCKYRGECHERLYDINGRDIHSAYNSDILDLKNTKDYFQVVLLHHQRLKSRNSLIDKGRRWARFDMLKKSAEGGWPVDEGSWVRLQEQSKQRKSYLIPREYWDYKE